MGAKEDKMNTPQVFYIEPDEIKRDLESPSMKGLIRQGYTIGPAMLWQESKGQEPKLALIMVPTPTPEKTKIEKVAMIVSIAAMSLLSGLMIYQVIRMATI